MAGFENYIIIFVLALILFGPKKLPELARQLGKLMAEFRKASNEFKMQMEEELRVSERLERDKKVAALEASAPSITCDGDAAAVAASAAKAAELLPEVPVETPVIATEGELTMHPPATGLPVAQTPATPHNSEADAVNALADSIPQAEEKAAHG
jgi:sec-independent protein translocase protein TatB